MDYRRIPDQRYPNHAVNIIVRKGDVKTGVPNDPVHCVAANAFCRGLGASMAVVLRTRTSLVFSEADGTQYVETYENGPNTRLLVEATDTRGLIAHGGVLLDLKPMGASWRPEAKRRLNAKRPKGGAKNPGSRPNTGKRYDPLTAIGVRSGTGMRFEVPEPTRLPNRKSYATGRTAA